MGAEFPFVYDMAFDYSTGTLYAIAGTVNASSLYIVNMASGSLIECMTYDPFLMSLAIDEKGTMYAMAVSEDISDPTDFDPVYSNAKLYTLDVKKGTVNLFMDTGVKSNQMASMAYDFDTGYIYWTGFYIGDSYVTGLHLIDPADKSCYNLGTIGGHSQVTGLMILADSYPKGPTNLQNVLMVKPVLETNVGASVETDLFMVPGTANVIVKWQSQNPEIATVDENGIITGVSAGTTTITAVVVDRNKVFRASCTVHVYYPVDDFFLVYNRDDNGFSAIDRTNPSLVTNLTENEEAELLRAMEMVDGVIYAYDEAGNYFVTSAETGYERVYLGSHGMPVDEAYDEVKTDGTYTYYYHYTPNFEVRDMAWDAANNRMLVLGCYSLIKEFYYTESTYDFVSDWDSEELELKGGCRLYQMDMETGALEELTAIYNTGGEYYSGVYGLTVTDTGKVFVYSTYLDFICSMNMDTGVAKHLATFQNLGYYGDSDCAPMSMTYDPVTGNIYVLFTQNGNAYFLFRYNVQTTLLTSMGSVGTEYDDCAGLVINRHAHAYEQEVVDATCTADGYVHYACSCGLSYTEEGEKAHGHDFVNGKCSHCGEVSGVKGDVNGDGTVNVRDVRLLMRYIAGLVEADALNLDWADYNGDGSINVRDVRAMMRAIAGLDG